MTATASPPSNILEEMATYRREFQPWLKRFHHVKVRVEYLEMAPMFESCPHCGESARRRETVDRGPIVDASLDGPILIMVRQGVYHCRSRKCRRRHGRNGKCFRFRLPFTVLRGRYTHRARLLGINSVKLDGMPFTKAVKRLAREFYMAPARSTAWLWHKEDGDRAAVEVDYTQWSVDSLSGVVCLDEMYDGEFCILMATDPLSKLTLGFQVLVGAKCDGEQMAEFMRYLDHCGIRPDVVVTDESSLYPKALQEVWPQAKHQLCLFHILRHIVKDVLKSVRAYIDSLPKDPKRRRGRPSKKGRPRSNHNSCRKELYDSRYLWVRNPEKVAKDGVAVAKLQALLEEHPALQAQRNFMLDVFSLFRPAITFEEAQAKRQEMLQNPAYQSDEHLKKALKKFEDDAQFAKMMVYTGYRNLNRTNNDVERANRWMRKKQKSHYRLRRKSTIGNAIAQRMQLEAEGRKSICANPLEKRPPAAQQQAA